MEVWFTARKRFDRSEGQRWEEYIRWAQLPQLSEVVSLDHSLCPSMFEKLIREDWEHNIHEDYRISYFRDLDYVIHRVSGQKARVNILAVIFDPESDPARVLADERFVFYGYDLIGDGNVSALTNCGGYFEEAFSATDISVVGLLEDYTFAREVQQRLRQCYPKEMHADCDLWAIWRLEGT